MILENNYWFDVVPANQPDEPRIAGKWLVFGSTTDLHALVEKVDDLVEAGHLSAAKIARKKPGFDRFPESQCVLCAFTSSDPADKERVRGLLSRELGLEATAWKSEEQTRKDWDNDGWLAIRTEIHSIQRAWAAYPASPGADAARKRIADLMQKLREQLRKHPDQTREAELSGLEALVSQIGTESAPRTRTRRPHRGDGRDLPGMPPRQLPSQRTSTTTKLFVSYNHADSVFVNKLERDLASHGAEVWRDVREIRVGESVIRKIREGIDRCDYFIVVLSQKSIKSEWVQREIDVATTHELETGKRKVLPVLRGRIDPPGFLKGKLYADFTKQYQRGLHTLLDALHSSHHINVIASVLAPDPSVPLAILTKWCAEDITPLIAIEPFLSLEITGGYLTKLRGADTFSYEVAGTFHPPARLLLFRDIPQMRLGEVTIVFGGFRGNFHSEPGDALLNAKWRSVMYIIGQLPAVRSVIEQFVQYPGLPHGLCVDLENVLRWWLTPKFTNDVPSIKVQVDWERSDIKYEYERAKGATAIAYFERSARIWIESERNSVYLFRGLKLLGLLWWLRRSEDVAKSDRLLEFYRACSIGLSFDWEEEMLTQKQDCSGTCGYAYRLENLMICTNCQKSLCFGCASGGAKTLTGQIACVCGGDIVD